MIAAACEVFLLGLLVCGAIYDIVAFRLPNWLTLATALVALPWLLLTLPSLPSFLPHLVAGLGMLLAGLLAFRLNMLGGGDVKWLASLAFWIGFNLDIMRFLVLTTLLGGGLAVVVFVLTRFRPDYGLHNGKRHLPYGVAIAAAGLDFWIRRSLLGQDLVASAIS